MGLAGADERCGRGRVRGLGQATAAAAMLVIYLAVGSSSAGAQAAQGAPTPTPAAPGVLVAVAPFDLGDPFLFTERGTYYLYVSTAFFPARQKVPVLIGDGHRWKRVADALQSLPGWAVPNNKGGTEWAPTVHRFGRGRYVLYYSPTFRRAGAVQHCIGLATASSPAGPFKPLPQPFICHHQDGGDIDASVFVDRSGPQGPDHPNYLVWKSDNNSTPGAGISTIWAQPLSNDGLHLVGNAVRIYQPLQPWQHQLIESPQMTQSPDGRVWLFYSAGSFTHPDYAMGAAQCVGPLGPCTDISPVPLVTSNAQGPGPGEETVFTASDGTTWLLYNPWFQSLKLAVIRPAEALRIGWNAAGPYVAEAGTFPGPARALGVGR